MADRDSGSVAGGARQWVAVVGNPYSGRGANQRRVQELCDALRNLGLASRTFWDVDEPRRALGGRNRIKGLRCVVVAGGDGTVADALNHGAPAPLAILPLGNENALARRLGFSSDAASLARAIARGRSRRMDVGEAAGRAFGLMVSVGLDAEVARRFAEWRGGAGPLRRAGRWSYAGPLLGALLEYRYPKVELEADGRRAGGTCALVFNAPAYALGLRFAPDGRDDDGLLDWVVFQGRGALRLASFYYAVRRGTHLRRPDVRHGRTRRALITSDGRAPVQIDGEEAGFAPVEVGIRPGAVEVIVP